MRRPMNARRPRTNRGRPSGIGTKPSLDSARGRVTCEEGLSRQEQSKRLIPKEHEPEPLVEGSGPCVLGVDEEPDEPCLVGDDRRAVDGLGQQEPAVPFAPMPAVDCQPRESDGGERVGREPAGQRPRQFLFPYFAKGEGKTAEDCSRPLRLRQDERPGDSFLRVLPGNRPQKRVQFGDAALETGPVVVTAGGTTWSKRAPRGSGALPSGQRSARADAPSSRIRTRHPGPTGR